jgi:NAD+ kinase
LTQNLARTVFLLAHTGRPAAIRSAELVVKGLLRHGIGVRVLEEEARDLPLPDEVRLVKEATPQCLDGCELLIVLGGDGTLLRAAELARPASAPVFGVNLGHVGFLAEGEPDSLDDDLDRLVRGWFTVEERLTVDVVVRADGRVLATGWALNEVAIEKAHRGRMLECVLEVDGHPLSRWGCDGVVMSTPTGSTAYAFSAGGPIVWPDVDALLVVPISAHALFARPLVVPPAAVVALEVVPVEAAAVLSCDGRRTVDLPPAARVEVTAGGRPVRLARLGNVPFTERLVRKFHLPVQGWRGRHI